MELVNVMKLIMDTAKPKYAFVEKTSVMELTCDSYSKFSVEIQTDGFDFWNKWLICIIIFFLANNFLSVII